ncbi:hypothetical protein ABK040_012382 [Willaertia magna]
MSVNSACPSNYSSTNTKEELRRLYVDKYHMMTRTDTEEEFAYQVTKKKNPIPPNLSQIQEFSSTSSLGSTISSPAAPVNDISIEDSSITVFGKKQKKIVDKDFLFSINAYEEVVIEEIKGKGQLYCAKAGDRVQIFNKIFQTDLNFRQTFPNGIVLPSDSTFIFKFAGDMEEASLSLYFRRKFVI